MGIYSTLQVHKGMDKLTGEQKKAKKADCKRMIDGVRALMDQCFPLKVEAGDVEGVEVASSTQQPARKVKNADLSVSTSLLIHSLSHEIMHSPVSAFRALGREAGAPPQPSNVLGQAADGGEGRRLQQ